MMKKLLLLIIALTACLSIEAAQKDSTKVKFRYDVDFQMRFDNREYTRSHEAFTPSRTIFGARLSPYIGLGVSQGSKGEHKLMLGVDIMKNFGANPISTTIFGAEAPETSPAQENLALFREITLFYCYHRQIRRCGFTMTAGIFPRRFSTGEFSDVFFSDSLLFNDNNLEGLLLQFDRPKSHFELGVDWFGMYGVARKEKFMIFSTGVGEVLPWMKLGYSAYMFHHAGSITAGGVVDNILFEPYIRFTAAPYTPLDVLDVKLGWTQAMQRERRIDHDFRLPGGLDLTFEISKWGAGIKNTAFYGQDMMPYYNFLDAKGNKYGNGLYLGNPFYRMRPQDMGNSFKFYDRLDIYYRPHLTDCLDLSVEVQIPFNGSYQGMAQVVYLRFNLDKLQHEIRSKRNKKLK